MTQEVDQALRDKFKVVLLSTVYARAPSTVIDAILKWDRATQTYKNPAIQTFFELFLGGVAYGKRDEVRKD